MSTAVHLEILYRAADGVGESLQWMAEERALYWVDITGRAIKRLEANSGHFDQWTTPGMPAAIVPRQAGGAVVAIDRRLAIFDYGDHYETLLTPEPDLPGNRLNEAAADPQGRLWVGTMENNVAPDGSPLSIEGRKGSLYVVDGSGTCRRAGEHLYGITNTLVWRDRTFITADTLAGELYVFDYDPDTGTIANRRLYCGEPGHPDGSCLDRDGYLWNARFGDGCLLRIDPDGRVDRVVPVPVRNPTTCCFGGEGLATLFVTSSRYGLDPAYVADHPDEGALMALDVGVAGAPTFRYAG